jgi:hypothetical protein
MCLKKYVIRRYLVSEPFFTEIEPKIRKRFKFYMDKVGGNFSLRAILTAQNP